MIQTSINANSYLQDEKGLQFNAIIDKAATDKHRRFNAI
jgi:hypothetical protein